jgi:dimethylargininase
MSFFDFNRAIVRLPSRTVANGLRAIDTGAPDFEGDAAEHRSYVRALEQAGCTVESLPALEDYPDAVFVEDTALVFSRAAIVLRLGAPTRSGEAAEIAPVLERSFERVLRLQRGAVEGGDVLATPRGVFIGLSARTNRPGADGLVGLLGQIGQRGGVVQMPPGVLHLKSDCSMLDEETILCTPRLASSDPFPGFRLVPTAEGEEGAANALRIGASIFVSDAFPRTADLLAAEGYAPRQLATAEIAKIDAGLSCMSLRWRA